MRQHFRNRNLGKCGLDQEGLEAVDLNNEIKDDIFTHWMPLSKHAKFIYD